MALVKTIGKGKVEFLGQKSGNHEYWTEPLSYTKVNFLESNDQQTDPDLGNYNLTDVAYDLSSLGVSIASITGGSYSGVYVKYGLTFE